MKKIDQHIIEKLGVQKQYGPLPEFIKGIENDSRKVEHGFVFVAIEGPVVDGHRFIAQAKEKGAVLIIAEHEQNLQGDEAVIIVEDTKKALGILAAWFYDYPSEKLKLTGVTGTNGKTSIVTLLYQLFSQAGFHSGLISTIENKVGNKILPAPNTTPGTLELNRLLAEMVSEGVQYVFMEVSSHGIDQGRIEGVRFAGGIFTNLTHEHLDYHKTFIDYRNTKKLFFDQLPAEAFALTNKDDKNGLFMLQNTQADKKTYAIKTPADFKAEIIEMDFQGMLIRINGIEFWTPLTGMFNAYNLTAVFGASMLLGMRAEDVAIGLSAVQAPAGRFERVISEDGKIAVIDYAHTPDALKNVLTTIREIRMPNQQIITVVGAGGDRDKTKRPEMASVATKLSDWVILTSDNPRTEKPEKILADMIAGVDPVENYKTLIITDRSEAIKAAERYAKPGDIILIAGKGHENYQIIGEEVKFFSDKEEILKHFKKE